MLPAAAAACERLSTWALNSSPLWSRGREARSLAMRRSSCSGTRRLHPPARPAPPPAPAIGSAEGCCRPAPRSHLSPPPPDSSAAFSPASDARASGDRMPSKRPRPFGLQFPARSASKAPSQGVPGLVVLKRSLLHGSKTGLTKAICGGVGPGCQLQARRFPEIVGRNLELVGFGKGSQQGIML